MTFTGIVDEVLARSRQTSDEARVRIGRAVNDRYRRVKAAIGMQTSHRSVVTAPTVVGNPEVLFTAEKLYDVFCLVAGNRRMLAERTFDEWRTTTTYAPASGPPQTFAISRMGPGTVTIVLDPTPQAIYSLQADALVDQPALAGTDVPQFAIAFHDILVHGALSDEWMQLKQDDLSKRSEGSYEARLSELRLFIAKSGYLAVVQGGRGGFDRGAYWPGYAIPRWWR